MAAALLSDRLGHVAELVPVASAGLLRGGSPADPDAVAVLARRGLDIAGHTSAQLTPAMVEEANLVLGMERRHVREAAVLVPGALDRSFTLPELVRRGEDYGPRRRGQSLAEWLAEVSAGRSASDLFGTPSDDVADPIGMGRRHFERLADELTGLAESLASLVEPVG